MKLPYNEYIKTDEYKQTMIRKKLWDHENNMPKGGWKYIDETPAKPVDQEQVAAEKKVAEILGLVWKLTNDIHDFMVYGPGKSPNIHSSITKMAFLMGELVKLDPKRFQDMTEHDIWRKSREEYFKK